MYVQDIKYLTALWTIFFCLNSQHPNFCVSELGTVPISSDNKGSTEFLSGRTIVMRHLQNTPSSACFECYEIYSVHYDLPYHIQRIRLIVKLNG